MRKGVGVGMLMGDEEREEALARPPKPKQEGVKLYCGDGELPTGYTGYETRFGCMRRGVGVGLRLPDDKRKAFQNKPPKPLSSRDISSMAQRLRVNVSGLSRDDALTALISRIREL
jgi:hypothetical protein